MDQTSLERLTTFVRPLYQDLDGADRLVDVERVSRVARALHEPDGAEAKRQFELILLFQGLAGWLGRMGNATRVVLSSSGAVDEQSLLAAQRSIARVENPVSEAEKALAAAIRVDDAGMRGLAARLAGARREGFTPLELAREILSNVAPEPEWMPEKARVWIDARRARQRAFCQALLDEAALGDLTDI